MLGLSGSKHGKAILFFFFFCSHKEFIGIQQPLKHIDNSRAEYNSQHCQ